MNVILAIDPGASGGFALAKIWPGAPHVNVSEHRMPPTSGDIHWLMNSFENHVGEVVSLMVAVMEDVPKCCGKALPAASMSVLHYNCGFITGQLMARGWQIRMVRPQQWQANLGLGTRRGCKSTTEWKNKLKNKAQQLYPGIKVALATADALLILDWYLRTQNHETLPQAETPTRS